MTPENQVLQAFRALALARAQELETERDGGHLPPLVRIVQTCCACPSQWDAWDAAGQYYYLRYRCGRGTVETAASEEDYEDQKTAAPVLVANFNHGDPLDGEISLAEFLRRAGMRLAEGAVVR
jgi:hypothetical protein